MTVPGQTFSGSIPADNTITKSPLLLKPPLPPQSRPPGGRLPADTLSGEADPGPKHVEDLPVPPAKPPGTGCPTAPAAIGIALHGPDPVRYAPSPSGFEDRDRHRCRCPSATPPGRCPDGRLTGTRELGTHTGFYPIPTGCVLRLNPKRGSGRLSEASFQDWIRIREKRNSAQFFEPGAW